MKNTIVPTLVIIALYASFSLGQANQKHVKHCCCEHTQQMADDLRWIREKMSKPYKVPPNVDYSSIPELDPVEFNMPEPKNPNIKIPTRPGRGR